MFTWCYYVSIIHGLPKWLMKVSKPWNVAYEAYRFHWNPSDQVETTMGIHVLGYQVTHIPCDWGKILRCYLMLLCIGRIVLNMCASLTCQSCKQASSSPTSISAFTPLRFALPQHPGSMQDACFIASPLTCRSMQSRFDLRWHAGMTLRDVCL